MFCRYDQISLLACVNRNTLYKLTQNYVLLITNYCNSLRHEFTYLQIIIKELEFLNNF